MSGSQNSTRTRKFVRDCSQESSRRATLIVRRRKFKIGTRTDVLVKVKEAVHGVEKSSEVATSKCGN